MPRHLPSIIIGVVGIAIGFLAGASNAALRGWGSPVVSVDVMNSSGAAVQSVSLQYESCGQKTLLPAQTLGQGQQTTFRFLVCGEGGYQVQARLDDGRELKGRDGYVESGYHATEIVQASGVMSTVANR
jgi:hypothetical protein